MTDLNGTLPNAPAHGQDNKGTLEYWQRLIGKTYIGEGEKTALGEEMHCWYYAPWVYCEIIYISPIPVFSPRLISRPSHPLSAPPSRARVKVVLHIQLHRILAPNTPMIKDFRPWRLNVTMDDVTRLVSLFFPLFNKVIIIMYIDSKHQIIFKIYHFIVDSRRIPWHFLEARLTPFRNFERMTFA